MAVTAMEERAQAAMAPTVTSEQMELVRRTVAAGATADELKLYLYDCQRQNVHPLDKLLHFTKRGGKYTPVTSIDLMRIRAAESGEYAGADDAVFDGVPGEAQFSAQATVWRLVQGQRCAFVATARWAEYCPGPGSDHMWRKMPHTMLSKCAEALALRKGFPRQLSGLYAREELDQAGPGGPGSEALIAPPVTSPVTPAEEEPLPPVIRTVPPPTTANLPPGAVVITSVEAGWGKAGKAKGFIRHTGQHGGADTLAVFSDQLFVLAQECCNEGTPVKIEMVTSSTSKRPYVRNITRLQSATPDDEMLTDADIPF